MRERPQDIALLAKKIVAEHAAEGSPVNDIDETAIQELSVRPWPGNVRELRNVLRRAIAMASGDQLRSSDLAMTASERRSSRPPPMFSAAGGSGPPVPDVSDDLPIKEARERWVAPMEREYLVRLLKRCDGDLDRAAQDAGVHRKSLERLLRQHGLKASDLRKGD